MPDMPEYIRSLIVILVLATAVFSLARKSASAISTPANFTLRRNIWFALTLAAFLAGNFWLYLAFATLVLLYAKRRESNPVALYFFILFVLPVAEVSIPGMGLVNYFFDLSHQRILSFLILLPAFVFLRKQSDTLPFGKTGPDKVLTVYLLLLCILFFRQGTVTLITGIVTNQTPMNSTRQVFYLFIDVFLPYYVISRSFQNMQTFRDAILSISLAIMVLAPLAAFEFAKGWLLYSSVNASLDLNGNMTSYLGRDDMLRALATAGQPIALGYLMTVGIGFYLFIQTSIKQLFLRRLGMALLVVGLIAPLSRGPWIGAVVLLVAFIVTGRHPARRLASLGLAAMLAFFVASILPGGERAINLLPFIGTTEQGNIDYRDQLITNSMIVIQRNPLFGSINYLGAPELEAMRQGQGIIDIVNSYIGIALEFGFVGLGLFVAFFILTLHGISRAMRLIPDKDSEEYLLGRVLLAIIPSIMLMIVTVSSITVIPIVYWLVAALGVAYAQMVRKLANSNALMQDSR